MAAIASWAHTERTHDWLAPYLPKPSRRRTHGYCRRGARAALTGRRGVARGHNVGGQLRGVQRTTGAPDVVVPPPPPDTAWPPTDLQGGWGVTLNGGDAAWESEATAMWDAMTPDEQDEWTFCRIEARWDVIEPTAGHYVFPQSLQRKVDWCEVRGIIPILDFTYCPYFYTIQPTRTVTITNTAAGGNARLTGPDLDTGDFTDIHVRVVSGPGAGSIPTGAVVVNQGVSGTDTYVDLDKPATSTGSGRTVTFGGYSGLTQTSMETDKHMPPRDSAMQAAANAAVALMVHFRSANPKLEVWNESNGKEFWRPNQDVARYATMLRFIFRGMVEYDPSVHVITTGCSNQPNTTNMDGWSLDAEPYLANLWTAMEGDATWAAWCAGGSAGWTPTPYSKPANNLPALITAGAISPRYYMHYAGYHAYNFGHTSNVLDADNHKTWLSTGSAEVAAKFVRMLNTIYTKAHAGGGDPNFDRLRFFSTETGCPTHPLAVTGRGDTGYGANRRDPATHLRSPWPASSEEAYVNITQTKKLIKKVIAWPTTGAVPAKLGTWDVRDRWACVILQRLSETVNNFAGGDQFANQGFFTNVAAAGPPAIGAGVLKRAIAAERPPTLSTTNPRPRLNGANFPTKYTNAIIGNGSDMFDAFKMVWTGGTNTLRITTTDLPDATVGSAYSFQMQASGATGTKHWTATGLGAGLSISDSGLITATAVGSPAGNRTVAVTVTDDNGPVSKSYVLQVKATGGVTIVESNATPLNGAASAPFVKTFHSTGFDSSTMAWDFTVTPSPALAAQNDPGDGTDTITLSDGTGTALPAGDYSLHVWIENFSTDQVLASKTFQVHIT